MHVLLKKRYGIEQERQDVAEWQLVQGETQGVQVNEGSMYELKLH